MSGREAPICWFASILKASSPIRCAVNALLSSGDCEHYPRQARSENGGLSCMVRTPRSLGGYVRCGKAIMQSRRLIGAYIEKQARNR